MSISFQSVSFAYPGNSFPLFEDVTVHFAEGWAGIVGVNGSGKTTLLQLVIGQFKAQTGAIKRTGD
jgi:ABC-type bacteriocin/lantibiotic exporter with double-glycine peptidase domain